MTAVCQGDSGGLDGSVSLPAPGTAVARAAEALAGAAGRKHCVLTADWSTAALVALRAMCVGPGDVVLMPATTWAGCAASVSRTGALPVFYDASHDCLCAAGSTPDVTPTVVLAVHLYAQHCDIGSLRARYPRARILEDASHSPLGGRDRPAGGVGDVTVTGLQASCPVTAGVGGAVLTDDPALAARARVLADSAPSEADGAPASAAEGGGSRGIPPDAECSISDMSAALLLDQLQRAPGQAARRARGAQRLVDRLSPSRWRCLFDGATLRDGMFGGMALRIPDGRGPRERVIADVRAGTGLVLDDVYPPVLDGRQQRLGTFKQFSLDATLAGRMLSSRWWRHRHVVVPHWAFLAEDAWLDALADVLLGETRPVALPAPARPSVDVVVVTKGERPTLAEALASVAAQDAEANVRVTVFLDGSPASLDLPHCGRTPVRLLTPAPDEVLPEAPWDRIAVLRQLAVRTCDADYTAFLDDDNLWARDHLASLLELADSDVPAVHCWRELVEPQDTPAAPVRFPWLPPGPEADDVWRHMVLAGVMTPGESIVREGADIGMVDMGEWLFATWLLRLLRFHRPRTAQELDDRLGEDDILLTQLCEFGIPIACTERATLRYRLGGMSNPETPRPFELNRIAP